MAQTSLASTLMVILLSVLSIGHAVAQTPDARVKISGKSLGAGMGFSWGSGVLSYRGKEYPFDISGVSAGDIGFSIAELSGEVFNIKRLADFNGNYTSFAAGITVGGGGSGATMKNQNGVIMNVVATTQGLMFKLGVDGLKVELTK